MVHLMVLAVPHHLNLFLCTMTVLTGVYEALTKATNNNYLVRAVANNTHLNYVLQYAI